MSKTEVIYESDIFLKKGFLKVLIEVFYEIKTNRWLIFQLFKRDFYALYKQSFMGIIWAFIVPFVSVGTFVLLNQAGVFNTGEIAAPYAIYAIMGMAFWQIFSGGLIASSNSLVNAGSMITKINFSKKSLVISSLGQPIVSFLIQFGLVMILCVYYNYFPEVHIILMPLLIIPIILITIGLGFILAILNGVMRDTGNIISLFLTFLMFLTPVLYSKPKTGILETLTNYNPLYYLVSVPRELILVGTVNEWEGFIISSIFSIFIFLVCIFVFHLTEVRVAERI